MYESVSEMVPGWIGNEPIIKILIHRACLAAVLLCALTVTSLLGPEFLLRYSPYRTDLSAVPDSEIMPVPGNGIEEILDNGVNMDRAFGPLPIERAPNGSAWRNSLALCTMIKWEMPEDVLEWVQYYKWLGVDKIGIVENDAVLDPALQKVLRPYTNSGFVHLEAWGNDDKKQNGGFARCFRRLRQDHDWVAFFDADEFLVVLEKGKSIKDLLDDYKEYPGVSVNWITFGSGGRRTRPAEGGVLRWYTQCNQAAERFIKTIANSYHVLSFDLHPHNFFYRGGAASVTEDYKPVPPKKKDACEKPIDHKVCYCTVPDDQVTGESQCLPVPGAQGEEREPELTRMALLHYATKSQEDFELKMKRGGGNSNGNTKKSDFFELVMQYVLRSYMLGWPRKIS